ncbi:hypothetical protein [Methylotenera sp.]|nr:hypothetical protein [Methylotenera sp.]MDP3777460.1 hypothetical protein [Methylotenera sp.]
MFQLSNQLILLIITHVSAQANSRSDVKRSGRSQNRRLQKGLPA